MLKPLSVPARGLSAVSWCTHHVWARQQLAACPLAHLWRLLCWGKGGVSTRVLGWLSPRVREPVVQRAPCLSCVWLDCCAAQLAGGFSWQVQQAGSAGRAVSNAVSSGRMPAVVPCCATVARALHPLFAMLHMHALLHPPASRNLRPAFAMPEVFAHVSTGTHELVALSITGRREGVLVLCVGCVCVCVVRQGLGVPSSTAASAACCHALS